MLANASDKSIIYVQFRPCILGDLIPLKVSKILLVLVNIELQAKLKLMHLY